MRPEQIAWLKAISSYFPAQLLSVALLQQTSSLAGNQFDVSPPSSETWRSLKKSKMKAVESFPATLMLPYCTGPNTGSDRNKRR